jgi:hypothetical protein
LTSLGGSRKTIEHLTLTAHFVKRIHLEQGWLRRHNDPAAAEMQEANTIDAIEQLLAEGVYDNTAVDNSPYTSLASMGIVLVVMTSSALRILDDYGVTGMKYTCYDKIYTVPGIGRAPLGLPGRGISGLVPGFTRTGPRGLLVGSTGYKICQDIRSRVIRSRLRCSGHYSQPLQGSGYSPAHSSRGHKNSG